MEQGVLAGAAVSLAWIFLQIAWMHVRPAANRIGAMFVGYIASLPFVFISAPHTAMGLFHAYLFHLLLFFFYVQCFYHVERSVSLRMLIELLRAGPEGLPLETLGSRYSVAEMVEQRLLVLRDKGFLERRDDTWRLRLKGLWLARAAATMSWIFQAKGQHERL